MFMSEKSRGSNEIEYSQVLGAGIVSLAVLISSELLQAVDFGALI